MLGPRTLLVGVVLLVVCFQVAMAGDDNQRGDQCSVPRPLFCTNVDWNVPLNISRPIIQYNAELQLQIGFSNFDGNRFCKNAYREIMCRYAFPKCDDGPPCRSQCEEFNLLCPGALQPCNSFPTVGCYTYDIRAGIATNEQLREHVQLEQKLVQQQEKLLQLQQKQRQRGGQQQQKDEQQKDAGGDQNEQQKEQGQQKEQQGQQQKEQQQKGQQQKEQQQLRPN